MDMPIITVSQINKYINNRMKLDDNLSRICIKGEISNYKTYPSGHSYFTLKDSNSELSAVFFKNKQFNLDFKPENGMEVIAEGYIEVYVKTGHYQLYVNSMKKSGKGELYLAYERLKMKLEGEGLFDASHKREIPKYPKRIGVVTASTGAAIKDIITTIERRYPLCEIYVFSTLVQGQSASDNITRQINHAQNYPLDTLIVGRGGGSIEDLWPFNEENVARAIYNSKIPVISAVGHEIDYTIADFVADLRAATPTAAAEQAVPNKKELLFKIKQYNERINYSVEEKIKNNRDRLNNIENKSLFRKPESLYDIKRMDLDNITHRFIITSNNIINSKKNKISKTQNSLILQKPEIILRDKRQRFINNISKLEVLNPLLTLKRGYTITRHNNKPITSKKNLKKDDELTIEFCDGKINTKVI